MTLTTLVDGVRETRELAEGTYLIGRGASCRVRFDAPEVSERHAILTVRDGAALLDRAACAALLYRAAHA